MEEEMEFTQHKPCTPAEAARRLRSLADLLEKGSVPILLDEIKIPEIVMLKVEIEQEQEEDGTEVEIEIEIGWTTRPAKTAKEDDKDD